MTDKQIIYDNVDVKDCIAYAKSQTVSLGDTLYKQMEKVCMVKNQPCKFFDCQFKQMARELKDKKKECEELKDEILHLRKDGNKSCAYCIDLIEKEKQLDKIKQERKALERAYLATNELLEETTKKCTGLKTENDELKHQLEDVDTLVNEKESLIDKCLQTLTEIKEIVNKNYKTEEELFKIRHSRLPKFSMGALNGRHNLASEILQKISECEVE